MNGVAQVGGTSAVVSLDEDGNVWYFWQTIGSSAPFSPNQVTRGQKVGSAPSVAGVGDQAVIAVVGPDQTLWVYHQPSSTIATGGSWNLTWGLGFAISQAPSIAQVGDLAVIAVVDDFGTLWSFQQNPSTGHRLAPQKVAGSAALQSPSVARVGDSAVIAAVDDTGSLWFYWQAIGTTLWSPGQLVDGPAKSGRSFAYPSVAQGGDASVVIAVDNTGSLWSYWQTIGSSAPFSSNPVFLTEPEAPFSTLPYPSIAQVGDSAVIAAANSNPDVSLWFYWQANPAAQWIPEGVPSGTILASPSVAQVGNSSVITASDDWGNLLFFWQTIGTAEWHPEQVASSQELGG